MALPAGQQLGAQLSGKLVRHLPLRFADARWRLGVRLDAGRASPAAGPAVTAGPRLEKGVVSGTMLVDQKRRWLTESWFSIVMSSVTTPPLTTGVVSMHMLTRITQHMYTFERK